LISATHLRTVAEQPNVTVYGIFPPVNVEVTPTKVLFLMLWTVPQPLLSNASSLHRGARRSQKKVELHAEERAAKTLPIGRTRPEPTLRL